MNTLKECLMILTALLLAIPAIAVAFLVLVFAIENPILFVLLLFLGCVILAASTKPSPGAY